MPKNICKCHVANKEKKFSICEQQKMDWNVISSAINDVFSIIRDPSLIDINMLLLGFDSFALIRDPSLICYCSMLM
jgi:hypothetical protein